MYARLSCVIATVFFTNATPAAAEGFEAVNSRDAFVELISGRVLTRFGIQLNVSPNGDIGGRAFGRDVTGDWAWNSGYFCRDLFFGSQDLGPNCQLVQVDGDTVRFTSDRGEGIYADLRLR